VSIVVDAARRVDAHHNAFHETTPLVSGTRDGTVTGGIASALFQRVATR
jgi:hypothetical protein